ncbi:MAG: methyltransferase domain-containing protein, partial [Chlorobia bacterium]|nr:methyltransferase domain-containing protein [Fimbriimonadaceae bacterium]
EAAGWDASAQAWIDTVQNDSNRKFVLDEPMLAECGQVSRKQVLDVGCGEGRFCRMLTERGATTTGIDITVGLIEEARKRHPEGSYDVGNAEALPYNAASFDIVVSYVVLLDIPDFRAAIREMARVLKPGGKAVVSNLQSYATTIERPWMKDEAGNKLHFAMDNYNEEVGTAVEWEGISIYNYHRPLHSYLNAFLESGLQLVKFLEPLPSLESIQETPSLADYLRVPFMNLTTWLKP